jgi:serine phosphatase RsbU (regulator of sigma subunit)
MATSINSVAFRHALLRTERLRIYGTILIVAVFVIAGSIRIYLFGSHLNPLGLYCAVALIGYEALVLRAVQRSMLSGSLIADWFWTINIIIEMSMPALAIAFLASDRLVPDYRPLATSWVLLFFPFLVLSTLRLSGVVSGVAGVTGALGYLLAARHLGWHIKTDLQSNPVTHSAVAFFAVMICATGFIAALVAREIRKHVQAALNEAETQRVLKQMEHDLTIARSIQQSLLPKVRPRIQGYEIAGWNRSADATGGDYFDWTQLEDGSLVVTLADVTGHGIGPALLASVCRAYARASFNSSDSLANVMQRINKSFGDDLSPGRFATFVAAVCRAGEDKLELLSAGHAPLFVYSHSKGQLQIFPAHDVPLGILPQLTSASSQVVAMQTGDLILLITDGFLEWENPAGEQFGTGRLEKVICANCHLAPEEMIAELYARVLDFADGTAQQDDLTAVVIKKTATMKSIFEAAA